MILGDSSVRIANLRGRRMGAVLKLKSIEETGNILAGDLILREVLQGARSHAQAQRIEAGLRQFQITPLLDDELAVPGAEHYRNLREKGVTIRKTIDLIIGTFCIAHGRIPIHDDRDFEPMAENLNLQVS